MAELRFEKGFLKGKTIQIPLGRYLVVGRAKEAGLPLPDPQLSRRHCKLTHNTDGILLEDLGSRNGTYVNGQAVTTVKLRHGDQVHFGDQVATYDHPKGLMDSSGDYESEEAEATREIPELQPGQAMLLNPPKIVRGPDSAPPKPPTQIGAPQLAGGAPPVIDPGGLLPSPSAALDADLHTELPEINQPLPPPQGLDDAIEADLSAPLPALPPNPISMEETMVRPQQPRTDPAKAPPPKSKIKKLMESYKAEVMASSKDEVKPIPKAKPATKLQAPGDSAQGLAGAAVEQAAAEGAAAVEESEAAETAAGAAGAEGAEDAPAEASAPALRPMTRPGSTSAPARAAEDAEDAEGSEDAEEAGEVRTATPPPTTPAPPRPVLDDEAEIEEVLEATDREMRASAASGSGAAAAAKPAPHPKTIPLRRDPTPEEEAAAAKRASQLADSFAEELLNRELSEEAEVIGAEEAAAGQDGPFEADVEVTPAKKEWRPDETGEIDPEAVKGAGGEIAIDTSRIDRHREIADEIFRAAQGENEEAAEEAADEEVIEEVDEDFDLESLEQVAAPTLDLGKLDKGDSPAGSGTTMEAVPEKPANAPKTASRAGSAARSPGSTPQKIVTGKKMTPPPVLPPILAEEHLEAMGVNEDFAHCKGLWEKTKAARKASESNLLGPILAKNEEYRPLTD